MWCSQAGAVRRVFFLVGALRSCGGLWQTAGAGPGRWPRRSAATAIFTGAAALAQNVWELGAFRFLAGIGIGGEWALAGTYVAEVWPESRRKMGAGYLQTGYYVGLFPGGGA